MLSIVLKKWPDIVRNCHFDANGGREANLFVGEIAGHLQRKIVAEDYYSANTRDDAGGQSLEMH